MARWWIVSVSGGDAEKCFREELGTFYGVADAAWVAGWDDSLCGRSRV